MHVGKTAYSGHYTAQIRDFSTQEWHGFNDQVITKIKKKQQLGCTEDELESSTGSSGSGGKDECSGSTSTSSSGGKTSAKPTASSSDSSNAPKPSKTFSTANAYLLVYYR